jgi:hypothetical protein
MNASIPAPGRRKSLVSGGNAGLRVRRKLANSLMWTFAVVATLLAVIRSSWCFIPWWLRAPPC